MRLSDALTAENIACLELPSLQLAPASSFTWASRFKLTKLVDIILALCYLGGKVAQESILVLGNDAIALRHDVELMSWEIVLLDRFANNLFGDTIWVDVGRVPLQYRLTLDLP